MERWHTDLLTRARERRLEKVAAAYAVMGWLVVQAAAIALPAFHEPDWLLRWLIVAIVLGFPSVLAAAWIWNRERFEAAAHLSRLDIALLGTIATIGCLTLAELAWHWSSESTPVEPPPTLVATEGSIAVLPFANTSGNPKERYFSEGLSDELIGLLARNTALRVAARTSSYSFEGKNEDIRAIAEKLNVRAVLEGSVRTDNGRVRIEANLIDAANGFDVWSQSYDRSLSDILLVQADIAQAIAKALVPRLLGGKGGAPKAHTIDPGAYRLFLQGAFEMGQRTEDNVRAALPLFREVARRAPDFAEGQANLAYDLDLVSLFAPGPKIDMERDAALAKALTLDPSNPTALTLAITLAINDRRWDVAIDDALILRRTNPHNAMALHGLASVYEEFGLNSKLLAAWQEAVRLDPLSLNARTNLAATLLGQSRRQEGLDTLKEALKLSPNNASVLNQICIAMGLVKQTASAKTLMGELELTQTGPNNPTFDLFDCRFAMAVGNRDTAAMRQLAERARAGFPSNGFGEVDVGYYLALADEPKPAAEWFERAYDAGHDVFDISYPLGPLPQSLSESPSWIALTKRPAYQLWSEARIRALREFGGG